jgi:glycosyltransferase involved in cell wall biosynthesis
VLRVVTVMRLAPRKRAVPLVRILARAQAALAPVEVRATVIGDGPTRSAAERAARTLLPGGVTFTGRLDRAGILRAFAESDVFCLPSVREAFGLAALEARTAGLPVIARSQTGAVDFVRDGVTGLLADDDAGMAAALVRLAHDRSLLEQISAHNRAIPPEQQWPEVLDRTRAAYAAAAS